MSIIPVTLSLYVSWLSAISFLGEPVEMYKNGSLQFAVNIGCSCAIPVVAFVFVPTIHKAQFISAYQVLMHFQIHSG